MKKEKVIILNENTKISHKRWINYEFKKRTFQKNTPLNIFIQNNINEEYSSSIARDYTSKYLKKFIWMNSMDTIVTTFKLRDTTLSSKNPIIYGFLYSDIENLNKPSKENIKINHTYFCCGPSLLSKDGEYRQRICLYSSLDNIIRRHKKLWDILEEYILLKIKSLPWNYYAEYFYPTIKQKIIDKELVTSITKDHIPIKFLIISWFTELFNIINNIPVNHINKLFLDTMRFSNKKIIEKDKKFYYDTIKIVGKDCIISLRHHLNVFKFGTEAGALKLGQKLTPLNMSEIQNPFNIKYKPWRELLISGRVQDLIINGICKGFPYIGDYFYIKDIKKTLFDNYVQYMKLEHSELVKYIARQLLEAQRLTYQTIGESKERKKKKKRKRKNKKEKKLSKLVVTESGEKIKRLYKDKPSYSDEGIAESIEEIEFWLSEKFRILYNKINDPIEYGKRDIIMSDVAFGILSEYVGRTFYDFLILNDPKTGSKEYIKETGDAFNNYPIWAKYIFEYIYNLLAMNIHLGIIHGDFHLNNGTIHPMFYREYKKLSDLHNKNIKTYMLYILKTDPKSEENIVYGFPSNQYHSCIIDFGRSIILPSKIKMFKDNNIKTASKIKLDPDGPINLLIDKDDENTFYREQVVRTLNLIKHHFSDFYENNKIPLEVLLFNSLEELFPILTAIDIYRFTTEIKKYFSHKSNMFHTKQYKLISEINSAAALILTNKLQKIINNTNLLELTEYRTYSNWKIINEFFSEFIIMSSYENEWEKSGFVKEIKKKTATIIDVSFLHNKLNYSLDSYNQYPEFLKWIKLKDKKGNIKFYDEKNKDPSKHIVLQIEKEKKKNLEIISLIARRHKEKYI